jgi:hypothetical protein
MGVIGVCLLKMARITIIIIIIIGMGRGGSKI